MNETTKESKFLDAINQYAEKQKTIISNEVEAYKAQKIEQATESGLKDAYELIQRDIAEHKTAIITEYAQKEYALRRELYDERKHIADMVFDEVREKLAEYTGSPAYRSALIGSAKEAASICGDYPCRIMLRAADMIYADDIITVFKDAEACEDSSIVIGGVKVLCESRSMLLDDTLDTKLDAQRARFSETSGLKVV